jgi:putative hydrolase of the HAD superfamily
VSRTLLFDVDGVLIHGVHAKPHLRRRWSTHLKDDLGVDEEQYVREFIREGFVRNVMLDKRSLVAELEDWLPKTGYTGSPLSFIAYWLNRDSQLNQPLLAAIRRLRGAPGVGHVYIATNQEHLRAYHLWATLGLQHIFDDILYAARLGAMKPDRAFFEAAAKRLGPQDEPPLMFDDSEEVVTAARTFGWDAATYDRLEDVTGHPWVAERLNSMA